MDFFYRIKDYGGVSKNYKMSVDMDTFLDLWNDTKTRCYSIEGITRDQYYEHIAGKIVVTYPVSKLVSSCTDKSAVYECYEIRTKVYL